MNTLAPVSDLKHTETEYLSFLLEYAAEKGLPVALWRLPGSAIKQLIISESTQLLDSNQMLEDLDPGFIMAPFDKEKPRFFLPADYLLSFENGSLKSGETEKETSSTLWLQRQMKSPEVRRQWKFTGSIQTVPGNDEKKSFLDLITTCVREIERGTLEKIVPSRIKSIPLPEEFDLINSFRKLCDANPNALVSFVSIPGVGNWLGATPEVLVTVEDKSVFKTVALAGTLPYNPGVNLKSVAWTQKEIEEQALVERYVISCFKKVRLREYEEHGPKTVIAGNVLHLKSEFSVDMKATNFPQMGSVMLQLLHPTSAVCGMPLEAALRFLQLHEGHDRAFYSGYLGPVNVRDNIHLFVNLRCMQIVGDRALLYAGAGVTIDSLPDEEWAETEIKFNTLLNAIL
jgi:isochorismate synthase